MNKDSQTGWYRKTLANKAFITYPACPYEIKEYDKIAPETMSNLLLQYPMLKEYMKYNYSEHLVRAHDLKSTFLNIEDRRDIENTDWLK